MVDVACELGVCTIMHVSGARGGYRPVKVNRALVYYCLDESTKRLELQVDVGTPF